MVGFCCILKRVKKKVVVLVRISGSIIVLGCDRTHGILCIGVLGVGRACMFEVEYVMFSAGVCVLLLSTSKIRENINVQ